MIYKSPRYILSSFDSIGLFFQKKKSKIAVQDGNCGSHLVFPIGTILAILNYKSPRWFLHVPASDKCAQMEGESTQVTNPVCTVNILHKSLSVSFQFEYCPRAIRTEMFLLIDRIHYIWPFENRIWGILNLYRQYHNLIHVLTFHYWVMSKYTFRSYADNMGPEHAQSDQGIRCPLTESLVHIV